MMEDREIKIRAAVNQMRGYLRGIESASDICLSWHFIDKVLDEISYQCDLSTGTFGEWREEDECED